MSLLQINPYEVNSFKRSSYTREVAQEIYKIFGPVTLDFLHCYSADHNDRPNHRPYGYVPNYLDELCIRENMLVSPANRLFNISIFYYIKFLTDLNPDKIVDIGSMPMRYLRLTVNFLRNIKINFNVLCLFVVCILFP